MRDPIFVFKDGRKRLSEMNEPELRFMVLYFLTELELLRGSEPILDDTPAGINDARH